MSKHLLRVLCLLSALGAIHLPLPAAEPVWRITVYSQAGYAQQPLMNERAKRIEQLQIAPLERSIDVTPYVTGLELTRDVSDLSFLGARVDYGRAPMQWKETRQSFPGGFFAEQKGEIGEAMISAGRFLCRSCTRFNAFAKAGAGAAYAKSSFYLDVRPSEAPQHNYARARSTGWFPVATAGVGVSGPLVGERWIWEAGAGYTWGRMSGHVPAEGSLRFPGETGAAIEVETDLTGPSVWVGIGTRF